MAQVLARVVAGLEGVAEPVGETRLHLPGGVLLQQGRAARVHHLGEAEPVLVTEVAVCVSRSGDPERDVLLHRQLHRRSDRAGRRDERLVGRPDAGLVDLDDLTVVGQQAVGLVLDVRDLCVDGRRQAARGQRVLPDAVEQSHEPVVEGGEARLVLVAESAARIPLVAGDPDAETAVLAQHGGAYGLRRGVAGADVIVVVDDVAVAAVLGAAAVDAAHVVDETRGVVRLDHVRDAGLVVLAPTLVLVDPQDQRG